MKTDQGYNPAAKGNENSLLMVSTCPCVSRHAHKTQAGGSNLSVTQLVSYRDRRDYLIPP